MNFIEVTRLNGGKPTQYILNTSHIVKIHNNGKDTVITTTTEHIHVKESFGALSLLLLPIGINPDYHKHLGSTQNETTAPDGAVWITNTGEQPVSDDTRVVCRFAVGCMTTSSKAADWIWDITGDKDNDITHWRLAKEGE